MYFVNTDKIFFIKTQRLNYKNTAIETPVSTESGKTHRFNFEHLIYANCLALLIPGLPMDILNADFVACAIGA